MARAGCGSARDDARWTFELSTVIRREPADVFDFLADVQTAEPLPRRARVRMTKTPSGPTGVGTGWHEDVELAPWMWLHIESRVTDCVRPHRLAMDFRSRFFHGHLLYDIAPDAAGSVLEQREWLAPRWPLRAAGRWVAGSLEQHLRQRLDDIRSVLEATVAPVSATEGR